MGTPTLYVVVMALVCPCRGLNCNVLSPQARPRTVMRVLRGLVLVAVVLSVSAAEEAAEPTEPEPVPAEGAAAEEAVPEEPEIVLNCNANGVLRRLQLASVTLPLPAPLLH